MWDPSPPLFFLCFVFLSFFSFLFSLNRAQVSPALSISCLIQWALLIVLPAARDSQFRDKWADFQCKLASYLAQRPERLGMTCTATTVASECGDSPLGPVTAAWDKPGQREEEALLLCKTGPFDPWWARKEKGGQREEKGNRRDKPASSDD